MKILPELNVIVITMSKLSTFIIY